MKRRQDWFEGQLDLDPERLVFIDETWASTNMARRYGRAPRGQRLRMSVPHGHWKTTTFVGALRLTSMTAPMVLDGPINGLAFQAYSIRSSSRNSSPETWSSWTTSDRTRAQASVVQLKVSAVLTAPSSTTCKLADSDL